MSQAVINCPHCHKPFLVLHNPKRRRVEIKNPVELRRVEIEAYSIMAQVCINCPHCHEPFLVMLPQKRRRVEIESPVEICRVEQENTVEIESLHKFKETWSDQLGVNDAPTIVDAVGASITAQGASGRSGTDQGTNGDADAPFTDICIQQQVSATDEPASFGIATIIDSEETQDSGISM